MPKQSSQKFIGRNRPPRVHITYEVSTGAAAGSTELPFIIGVLADLSGNRRADVPQLQERRFVEVDPANFDSFLSKIGPELNLTTPNHLAEGSLAVALKFKSTADFSPDSIASQVPTLRGLLESRRQLESLLARMDAEPHRADFITWLRQLGKV